MISKIKDETKGVPMVELVLLKSNIYPFIKKDDEEGKKAKRINKTVVKNITHEEYKNRFFEWKQILLKMKRIESKSHQ